jgi:hypothetical protein
MRWLSMALATAWAAYIFLLPFHRVWKFPWLGSKLQPPEIVFLTLAAASVAVWSQRGTRWRFALADVAVAAWVGAHVLALALSSGRRDGDALNETIGAVYLACLYAAVRMTATPRLLDRVPGWFGISAAMAAALGVAGVVASWMGYSTGLATGSTTPIPYLGYASRAQALTAGPQMLASILLLALPLFVGSRMRLGWRRWDVACAVVLTLGLVATASKTALCLIAALSVMWACAPIVGHRRTRVRVVVAVAVSLSVAAVLGIGSRVLVLRQASVDTMKTAQLVGGEPLASFRWNHESWVLMPTTYAFNNQASVAAIEQSWPVGIGPAGQPAFTAGLQREGRFPLSIWITTPHSIYFGTAAELGAAGLISLALIVLAAGSAIRGLLAGPAPLRWEAAAYAGAGAAFLIEGISTDLLSCRHYWLLLAVIVARRQSVAGFVTTVASR